MDKEGEEEKSKGREERTKKKKEPKEDKETDRYGRTRRRASGASIGGKIKIQKREKKAAYREITKLQKDGGITKIQKCKGTTSKGIIEILKNARATIGFQN